MTQRNEREWLYPDLYREVFDHCADLIQVADAEGGLLFVNAAWMRRLGYRDAEVRGLGIEAFVAPEYLDLLRPILRCEPDPTSHRVRMELVTRHGARLWVDGNVSYRFEDGRAIGTNAIFRDITEHEQLLEMKSEFIAMVNHELRTPLTSLAGSLALMREAADEMSARSRGCLEIASRNTERLVGLVNDILDTGRLSAGTLEVTTVPVDVERLMIDVAEAHRGIAARALVGVEVREMGDPLTLVTDPQRLRQIVANFLANAVRHSAQTDTIVLSASRGNGIVRLTVSDEGGGIPVEFRQFAFEKFRKAAGARGGSGLGLTIAEGLAQRLGGTVGYWSVSGEGTSFYVDLPADCEAAPGVVDASGIGEVSGLVRALGETPEATLRLHQNVGALPPRVLLEELATCPDAGRLRVEVADARLAADFEGAFRDVA